MSPEEKLEMGRKLTARTLEEPTLMPLTLEEIEKRLATADRIKTDGISWRSVDLLLAIAQEQKAQIARLQDNASTAAFDKIADQLGEANRENEEQRAEIARLRADRVKFFHIAEVLSSCPMSCRKAEVYARHVQNAQELTGRAG